MNPQMLLLLVLGVSVSQAQLSGFEKKKFRKNDVGVSSYDPDFYLFESTGLPYDDIVAQVSEQKRFIAHYLITK